MEEQTSRFNDGGKPKMSEEKDNFFGEVISTYTESQAVEDGFLVELTQFNESWKKGMFNYVTTALFDKGYIVDDNINVPNILDLLNQSLQLVKKESNNFTREDSFFSGSIELPSGEQQKIFIQQNSSGKFTIMLPEDY